MIQTDKRQDRTGASSLLSPHLADARREQKRNAARRLGAVKYNAELCAALFVLLLFAVLRFGPRCLTVTALSAGCCVLLDFLTAFVCVRIKIADPACFQRGEPLAALASGMMMGLLYPVTVPFWLPVLGAAATVFCRRVNDAASEKKLPFPYFAEVFFTFALLMLCFPQKMTPRAISGKAGLFSAAGALRILSGAQDPMTLLKTGALPEGLEIQDLLTGNYTGLPGCVPGGLLLVIALYFLLRGRITWHLPLSFAGCAAVITFLLPNVGEGVMQGLLFNERMDFLFGELFGGGILFAAVFAALPGISPLSAGGKLFFGVGCGILTVFFRYFTPAADGAFCAVFLMGLLRDPLDRLALSLRYSGSRGSAGNAKTAAGQGTVKKD